jgi:hypothetical protein
LRNFDWLSFTPPSGRLLWSFRKREQRKKKEEERSRLNRYRRKYTSLVSALLYYKGISKGDALLSVATSTGHGATIVGALLCTRGATNLTC